MLLMLSLYHQPGGPIIIINIGLAQAGLSSKVYKNMYVKLFCVSR